MSSESKKKRGEAGQTKGQTAPFRLNGLPPDWAARKAGVFHARPAPSSGSTTMRGILGGVFAKARGHEMFGRSDIYDLMIAHAQSRCTHPLLCDEAENEPLQEQEQLKEAA